MIIKIIINKNNQHNMLEDSIKDQIDLIIYIYESY